MLLRILLISLAVSAILSNKTINRRRLDANCHRVMKGSCKNATEANTCTLFSDVYKSGTCEGNGYSVACKLRYGSVINYKDAASCKAAQDKALHRRAAATCRSIMDSRTYDGTKMCWHDIEATGINEDCTSKYNKRYDQVKGTCEGNGYSVTCKFVRSPGKVFYFKDAAGCEAVHKKELKRQEYYAKKGEPYLCNMGFGIVTNCKDAADCKAIVDKIKTDNEKRWAAKEAYGKAHPGNEFGY